MYFLSPQRHVLLGILGYCNSGCTGQWETIHCPLWHLLFSYCSLEQLPNATDIAIYRARVGAFHLKATRDVNPLYLNSQNEVIAMISLIFLNNAKSLALAIALCFVLPTHKRSPFKCCPNDPNISFYDEINTKKVTKSKSLISSFITRILLLLSGNVHKNPGPEQHEFRIIHINCRSLNKDTKLLIEAESDKYDIITLSETCLKDDITDEQLSIEGFHKLIRKDRPNNVGYGGVATYVKSSHFCKHRPDLDIDNLEAVWVETKIDKRSYVIGSFYRPPNATITYWDLIEESLRKANSTNSTIVLLGDFNSDFNHPNRKIFDIMNTFSLQQLVSENTRITENTATCLDLIFTQSLDFVKNVEVLPEICSDHSCPCLTIDVGKRTEPNSYKRIFYDYSKLNKDNFLNLLNQVNWNEILDNPQNDINLCAETFSQTFFDIANQCLPSRKVTIRSYDKPFVDEELKNSFETRYKLYKIAKRTDSTADWATYRKYRNSVTKLVRKKKDDYDSNLDKKVSNNENFGNKEFYKILKQFMNKKGINDSIPPLEYDGQIHNSSLEKANALNDYFIKQSTLENINDEVPNLTQYASQLDNIIISQTDVSLVIKNLDKTKASGPDRIHNRLLIAASQIISEPLSVFFTKCIHLGKFPNCWKKAHVTPLLKKPPSNICTNYRPISLISCVGKLFERCVHKHVFKYLSDNDILTKSQSGFIPCDSTTNQLIIIYDNLCKAFDDRVTNQSIFFDISKAFDKVWHKGLLHKLYSIGIRGSLHNWFFDYLSNRQQCVVLKGKQSDYKVIQSGVPQGSVLGPLLFLIYINDITNNIQSIIKLFADDTSISLALRDPLRRADILNADLEQINNWAKTWKIKFNAQKTELLNFKRDNLAIQPLNFDNSILQDTDTHKHLGLTLQNDCKWNTHINNLIQKVTLLLSLLKSYKYRLSRKALNQMYKSFILPHFDYCDIIYDNCTVAQSDSLEQLHLDGIRTIIGTVRGTSHEKLYKESGFTTLKERRRRHKLIFMHKIIHGQCPSYLSERCPQLVGQLNPYHRRRPWERRVPHSRTELYYNSFFPSATRLYNFIPDEVKTNPSISNLKRFLNQYDKPTPLYYFGINRSKEVHHARLRLGMSNLNFDMFQRHLLDSPACGCGFRSETSEHFLLHCPNFNAQRQATIDNIPLHRKHINCLLNGNERFSYEENYVIFEIVQDFIEISDRF